jgi:hypothetical protein
MNKKQTEGKKLDSRFVWTVSNFILMFLEPSILKYTSTPVFEDDEDIPVRSHTPQEKFRPILLPWQEFKSRVHDIYDHRIQHAQEIDGGVNNQFMSADEHLIVYYLQKFKTRTETEAGLINFLSSLKYYAEQWQRAKVYTQILGFYQSDESFLPTRQ